MQEVLINESVGIFLIILIIILITPFLSERLRLPGIIGLIIGGVVVGPYGLSIINSGSRMELLSTIGLVYLMFNAGLELDLHQFGQIKKKALLFGFLSFIIALIIGTIIGLVIGLSNLGAILLGVIFSSNTLVAYPIISKYEQTNNELVSITIGATVFTDIAALLVLSLVVSLHSQIFSVYEIITSLILTLGYSVGILWAVPLIGKRFFHKHRTAVHEFQFVLVTLFISAWLAEAIGMHAIVGAFLAGIAINYALPNKSSVVGQILFVGEALFIPIFLIYIGLLVDPRLLINNGYTLFLGLSLAIIMIGVRFIPNLFLAYVYHYSKDELMTAWGLSQAHAGVAIATVLVGMNVLLFNVVILNSVILVVMITCISSPVIVQYYISRLGPLKESKKKIPQIRRILLPIENFELESHLLDFATVLTKASKGLLLPLHVVQTTQGQVVNLVFQEQLLNKVDNYLYSHAIQSQVIKRVDTSIPQGILNSAIEHDVSTVIMGWHDHSTFLENIIGSKLDEVVWYASVPVMIGKFSSPINTLKRIIVILPSTRYNIELLVQCWDFVSFLAKVLNIPLFIYCEEKILERVKSKLSLISTIEHPKYIIVKHHLIHEASKNVEKQDLMVAVTTGEQIHFRSSLGDISKQLLAETSSSMLVLHYPVHDLYRKEVTYGNNWQDTNNT